MEYAAIAAIAASVLGALIDAGQQGEAQALRKQLLAQYGPELAPHLDQAVAQHIGGTAFGAVQEDDSLRRQQLQSIAGLQQEYETGGHTPADLAAAQLAQDTAAGSRLGDAAGIAQSMAARGAAGTPMDFALKSAASQGAANVAGSIGRSNAVEARRRAIGALESAGNMAGNVRTADYRRLSDAARAQDELNQFNNANDMRAQYYNLGLPQQQFDNSMLLANARSNVAQGIAAGYERSGAAARETAGGVGQGLLTWGTKKEKKEE